MIKIYSTPTCHFCKDAKDFLTENGYAFEEVDVQNDLDMREEMVRKSGVRSVPVIDVNGNILVGFDRHKLANLLESQ